MICRHCDADIARDDLPGHLRDVHHLRTCVLCARRGRATEVEAGHVCAVCRVRMDDQLAAIVRLAADAAAYVEPRQGAGGGRTVPGSRPPIDVEAIEPEMILVRLQPDDPTSDEPILWILESWERIIRDELDMEPYGPASEARTAVQETPAADVERSAWAEASFADAHWMPVDKAMSGQREQRDRQRPQSATLTGVVRFLRQQLDYATTEPTFGIEQFADEIALCWRALLRYDAEREGALTWRIECPADVDGQTCGRGLRIAGGDLDYDVTCPSCRTRWDVHRLLLVAAETTDAHMWLDATAITARTGVDRRTLDRWVREGRIERQHGRYDARPILATQGRMGA